MPYTTGFFYDAKRRRYGVIRNGTPVVLPVASVKRILKAHGYNNDAISILLQASRVLAGVRSQT